MGSSSFDETVIMRHYLKPSILWIPTACMFIFAGNNRRAELVICTIGVMCFTLSVYGMLCHHAELCTL